MNSEEYKTMLRDDIKKLLKRKKYLREEKWLCDVKMNEEIINYHNKDIMRIIQEEIEETLSLIEYEEEKEERIRKMVE